MAPGRGRVRLDWVDCIDPGDIPGTLARMTGLKTAALSSAAGTSDIMSAVRRLGLVGPDLVAIDPDDVRALLTERIKAWNVLAELEGKAPLDDSDSSRAAYSNAEETIRQYILDMSGGKALIRFSLSSPGPDLQGGTLADRRVPDCKYPQDILLVRDVRGVPHVVVVGFQSLAKPSGSIVVMPAEESALVPLPPPESGFGLTKPLFSNDHHRTVASGDPEIGQPRAIVRLASGRVFVWSASWASGDFGLFELVDEDGDFVPDRIDPRDRAPTLPRGRPFDLAARGAASSVGESIHLGMRILDAVDEWGDEILLRDTDGNGFYDRLEEVGPFGFFRRIPSILGGGADGARFVEVQGAAGHSVELLDWSEAGDSRRLARGTVSPDGIARFELARPLEAGWTLRARDTTNGIFSNTQSVGPSRAGIHRMDPDFLSTRRTTAIRLVGPRIGLASRVEVNGNPVETRRLGDDMLEILVPPVERGGEFRVVAFVEGSSLPAPHPILAAYGE